MFGSQILEVGIGLILIFLLVSLILTAVRETIEAWMKTRATDLERAIAELLNDQQGAGARANFYNHPLVTALFAGNPSLIDFSANDLISRLTWVFRTGRNLPSYIPRETFALAMEDLVRKGTAGDRLTAAHQALAQGFEEDAAKIRKGVEQLYDAAMDRAAGWYKRRSQWILFWLGLAIALLLNINAFTIAQHLATNEAARTQMVGIAEQLQGERAVGDSGSAVRTVPTPAPAAASPLDGADGSAAGDDAGTNQTAANRPATAPNGGDSQNAVQTGTPPQGSAATPPIGPDPSAAETARRLNSLVGSVGLPVGWDEIQVQRIEQGLGSRKGLSWLLAVLGLGLGYLSVALAATLGAPFWFDVLGKFMVIRSTVKPTEKSPDETSKDGGTGGAPRGQGAGGSGGVDHDLTGRPDADRAIETPRPVIFG